MTLVQGLGVGLGHNHEHTVSLHLLFYNTVLRVRK